MFSPFDLIAGMRLGDVLDDLHQLVDPVALSTGELDELLRPLDDGASLGRPRDRDAAPAPELEQALVAQDRSARSTVFVLTPRTAARSFAGGSRSPGFASPSAIARRISPATCS